MCLCKSVSLNQACGIMFKLFFFSDTLLKKVGLREKSKVIDLTRKGLTVESLTESKLMCSVEDKVRYPCRYHTIQYPSYHTTPYLTITYHNIP